MDDSQQDEPTRISIGAKGRSLVAAEALTAGTAVARFEGPSMSYTEIPEEERRHAIGMSGGLWLVTGSRARWLNHSCEPNCEIWDDLSVVSTRPVAAGEELTFSYDLIERESFERAPEEFFWDTRWDFDCRCGAPRCVGKIDRYRFAEGGPALRTAGRKT